VANYLIAQIITLLHHVHDLKGKIVDVVEQGYYLGDKVIRHAKVVLGQ